MILRPEMRAFLVICLFAAAPLAACAQQASPAAPTVILFVGNSFTYGGGTKVHQYDSASVTDEPPGESGVGGIPAIFKKFADEAGLPYEVHVEVVGGKDLEFHYTHALPLIAQAKWNAVVLQSYSTEPLPAARGGKPESFLKHATLLEKAVHTANPAAKIYLYETWPYPLKNYPGKQETPGGPLFQMSIDLSNGYRRAFTEDGHFEGVAPVGSAWMGAVVENVALSDPTAPGEPGKIDLWDTDKKHPSIDGSYLAALVLFQEITGSDVRKLGEAEQAAHDLGIAQGDAVKLQNVAAETMKIAAGHRK